jgi:hypothetical protein
MARSVSGSSAWLFVVLSGATLPSWAQLPNSSAPSLLVRRWMLLSVTFMGTRDAEVRLAIGRSVHNP